MGLVEYSFSVSTAMMKQWRTKTGGTPTVENFNEDKYYYESGVFPFMIGHMHLKKCI